MDEGWTGGFSADPPALVFSQTDEGFSAPPRRNEASENKRADQRRTDGEIHTSTFCVTEDRLERGGMRVKERKTRAIERWKLERRERLALNFLLK